MAAAWSFCCHLSQSGCWSSVSCKPRPQIGQIAAGMGEALAAGIRGHGGGGIEPRAARRETGRLARAGGREGCEGDEGGCRRRR